MSHHEDHASGHDHGYRAALDEMRRESAHLYADHFDWRGHQPPADFAGPRFFPPAEEWRLQARLDTDASGTGDEVTLPTSTGLLRPMTVAGELVFNADGGEHRLLAYASKSADEEGWLFVPFRDASAGKETYGAGRYVDVPPQEGGVHDLDFNLAYNPSCAYSPAYDCPFPPARNRLHIEVRAGEMLPFEHAHEE